MSGVGHGFAWRGVDKLDTGWCQTSVELHLGSPENL